MELTEGLLLLIPLAFICEFVDSSLGMGYGTSLTPLLLMMGYSPLSVVPAILASELVTGGLAAFMHNNQGNVAFDFRNDRNHHIVKKMGMLGYLPRSLDSRIALVLASCSLAGAVAAVLVAVNISGFYLKLFIGVIVLTMGILIMIQRNKTRKFSWTKITGLGILAAFNKGLSGGGYGPLVTSGQILSGVGTKNSVAITSLAESFTCLVGVCTFLLLGNSFDWGITLALLTGAVLSVPFSTKLVRKIRTDTFTMVVGTVTILLGLLTLAKVLL